MAYYDGGRRPELSHDPLKEVQWQVRQFAVEIVTGIAEMIENARQALLEILAEIFSAIFKVSVTVENLIEEAGTWGDRVKTGIDQFFDAFDGIDLTDPGAVLRVIQQQIYSLMTGLVNATPFDFDNWLLGLLDKFSPLNASNLFGLVRQGNIGQIGMGQIGESQRNLIVDPDFGAFTQVGDYIPDPGEGVKVVADGLGSKTLRSMPVIQVSKDQKFTLKVNTRWTDAVGTGSPIVLGVTGYTYDEDTDTYSVVLEEDVVSQDFTPSTGGWRTIQGTYTVPDNVDAVRLRLTVTAAATAGTVWFKKAYASKKGKIPFRLLEDENGNGLPDVLEGFNFDIAGLLSGLATKAGANELANLIDTLSGSFASTLEGIQERFEDLLTIGSPINAGNIFGAIADSLMPTLGHIRDAIVNAVTQLTGTGHTQDDAEAALNSQTTAIVSMAAQLAQLRAERTSGVTDGDDFERDNDSNLGTGWSSSRLSGTSGSMNTANGHDAGFHITGFGDALVIARYLNMDASTDYCFSEVILGSRPEDPEFFGNPVGNPAYNIVSCRMSADKLTRIDAWFGNNEVIIYRWINGNVTELNKTGLATPGPGNALRIVAGKPGTARYFAAYLNNSMVLDVTEVGTASMLGAGYRSLGMGGRLGAYVATQSRPGRYKQWIGGDQ